MKQITLLKLQKMDNLQCKKKEKITKLRYKMLNCCEN